MPNAVISMQEQVNLPYILWFQLTPKTMCWCALKVTFCNFVQRLLTCCNEMQRTVAQKQKKSQQS